MQICSFVVSPLESLCTIRSTSVLVLDPKLFLEERRCVLHRRKVSSLLDSRSDLSSTGSRRT